MKMRKSKVGAKQTGIRIIAHQRLGLGEGPKTEKPGVGRTGEEGMARKGRFQEGSPGPLASGWQLAREKIRFQRRRGVGRAKSNPQKMSRNQHRPGVVKFKW